MDVCEEANLPNQRVTSPAYCRKYSGRAIRAVRPTVLVAAPLTAATEGEPAPLAVTVTPVTELAVNWVEMWLLRVVRADPPPARVVAAVLAAVMCVAGTVAVKTTEAARREAAEDIEAPLTYALPEKMPMYLP